MTTQEKIYLPLIQSFKTENIDLYKNNLWIKPAAQTDFSGLFIPHYISKEYESLEKKIFFVGQDTYEWVPLANVFNLSENDYLIKNNSWPNNSKEILKWINPYTFWNFVCKLQLSMNGFASDLSAIDEQKERLLNGIGWGNLYSLELPETIRKYGEEFNSLFDHNIYNRLLESSCNISKLKYILDAFKPDYVVILAWKYVENWYFDELEVEYIENECIPDLLSCYKINNTKVFWTYHPQALCRKSQDLNELTNYIINRL